MDGNSQSETFFGDQYIALLFKILCEYSIGDNLFLIIIQIY